MKKIFGIIGVLSLALLLAFSPTYSQAYASTTTFPTSDSIKNYEINAASREVSVSKTYSGTTINPPNTYYYSDSLGYRGNIPLDYIIRDYDNNITIAVYVGTVYCEGTCPQ